MSARDDVELKGELFAIQNIISDELLDLEPEIMLQYNPIWSGMVASIKARIYGEQMIYDEIEYPSDWWQAFKERWFPTWAKKRWPVRHEKYIFDARFLYPSIKTMKSHLYTNIKIQGFNVDVNT